MKHAEPFTYDDDGNLLTDSRWCYTYDSENRLISMETNTSVISDADKHRLEFTYDYLGRRVRKIVKNGYNGSSYQTEVSDTKFVYNGWNCIATLNANSSEALVASYFWGMDVAGPGQRAGGIGALLMIQQGGYSYVPAYDAGGNVHALIRTSDGSIQATYEYDAFGNTLRESGTFAASNPFRFSTKFTDTETGFVYFGLRYYSPSLGRFINRDPIGEFGGLNLYGYCGNNASNRWDYLGMIFKVVESERPVNQKTDSPERDQYGQGFDPSRIITGGGSWGGDIFMMATAGVANGQGVLAEGRKVFAIQDAIANGRVMVAEFGGQAAWVDFYDKSGRLIERVDAATLPSSVQSAINDYIQVYKSSHTSGVSSTGAPNNTAHVLPSFDTTLGPIPTIGQTSARIGGLGFTSLDAAGQAASVEAKALTTSSQEFGGELFSYELGETTYYGYNAPRPGLPNFSENGHTFHPGPPIDSRMVTLGKFEGGFHGHFNNDSFSDFGDGRGDIPAVERFGVPLYVGRSSNNPFSPKVVVEVREPTSQRKDGTWNSRTRRVGVVHP